MRSVVTLTEAKAKFSEFISRIAVKKERITITRKGKRVAVILPAEQYDELQKTRGGLILARGAMADASLDAEIDRLIAEIYLQRNRETGREVDL